MGLLVHCKYTSVFQICNTKSEKFLYSHSTAPEKRHLPEGNDTETALTIKEFQNMKIVIAADSFKGSLTSEEAGNAIAEGIHKSCPDADITVIPVADGGEGTTEALCRAMSGTMRTITASDPLGRPMEASYCIAGNTAIMEMSRTGGLPLLRPQERNPLLTSTCGTGEMILDALHEGCRHYIIGIGGSATNDAGTGMLSSLGYRFLDNAGNAVACSGGALGRIADIDSSGVPDELGQCRFSIACDVDTPFCGPDGAARVFAPQKGADAAMVEELEHGMESFARTTERHTGIRLDDIPGSGAAGGLGGAFLAFLNAELRPGAETVLKALDFSRKIADADLVITGEGKMDSQTLKGKTPYGVLKCASSQDIPAIAFCGRLEDRNLLEDAGFAELHEIDAHGARAETAMQRDTAYVNLRDTAEKTMASLLQSQNG